MLSLGKATDDLRLSQETQWAAPQPRRLEGDWRRRQVEEHAKFLDQSIRRHEPRQPSAPGPRTHAERHRVFGRSVRGRQERQAPEVRSWDHQHSWAQSAVDDLAADDHDAIVGHALRRDEELHLALPQRGASLGLHRDIGAVRKTVKQRIDTTIQQRAKDMKVSSRLLIQKRTHPILEDLAGGARLVARPGPLHEGLGYGGRAILSEFI